MAPPHFSARTQTPRRAGPTMRAGTGREAPQLPVFPSSEPHALCSGSTDGLESPRSGRSGPAGSVPPQALSPRGLCPPAVPLPSPPAPKAASRAARRCHQCGREHRVSAPQGSPPICAPPGQGRAGQGPARIAGPAAPAQLRCRGGSAVRDPQCTASSRRRRRGASPARPAPRRLPARRDGHPEHERSPLLPVPLPCPGARRRPPPGSAAPRPLPRRAGMRSLRRPPAAPVPQPGRL